MLLVLCLQPCYLTVGPVPPFYQQLIHVHLILSLETDYAFPLAEKVEASAGPSAFVAAASVATTITVTLLLAL